MLSSIDEFRIVWFILGKYLPRLSELRFNNSVVPCVRDLGTSLSVLKVLWMPCCTLKDLDGLSAFPSIRELYLAFNKIEDVSIVTMLSSLEILDIERFVYFLLLLNT